MMDNFVSRESVTRAEIKWSLHNTFRRTSLRCGSDAGELFEDMFPDSDIAKKFSMHKDKLRYVITHGLGPFSQSELTDFIRSLDFVTVSFDEFFNPIFHQSQMDLLVRYWFSNRVEPRYLSSTFLGHSTARDLLVAFIDVFEKLGMNLEKILQIESDGPNVNKKFLKDSCVHLNESETSPKLLEKGTCILHIVSGSYKTSYQMLDGAFTVLPSTCTICSKALQPDTTTSKLLLAVHYFLTNSVLFVGLKIQLF
ncbi:hypothetical protein QAD02_011765 [Eretmocerus hayati]|uniref:Uncharacterized protein n=1 Tax=Eretmocerus hayati TaxID=131215 RepID=A0ACC2P0D1_9HYME|nr:hypothetical protein QAD02_011765 [Eretmocerus hayati]